MKNQTPLTAQRLLDFLLSLQQDGIDLENVNIYHRPDRDSDEEIVTSVEEDLFDPETNSILTSIMLLNDASEI